jgi:hypothetical protein
MKKQIVQIVNQLKLGDITTKEAKEELLFLFGVRCSSSMTKVFDETYTKGAVTDDEMYRCMAELNSFTHKPTEDEQDLVGTDFGEMSYQTIVDKDFRIVVYVEQ